MNLLSPCVFCHSGVTHAATHTHTATMDEPGLSTEGMDMLADAPLDEEGGSNVVEPTKKRARATAKSLPEDCTIDPNDTLFYWRMPQKLLKNVLYTMLMFDKYALQLRKGDGTPNVPAYIFSVFQHNMSVVQTLKMDANEIMAASGHLVVNENTDVGFHPSRLSALISKPPQGQAVTDIEVAQLRGQDTLTIVMGGWTHDISLVDLETYRHNRLEPYDFDAKYVLAPAAFLSNLQQANNVPAAAKNTRESQVSLTFTEEGVVLGTVASEWDPGSKSSVLLSVGASKRRRNFDTNVITEVLDFKKGFSQLFDLRLLNSIIKAASFLCNEVNVEVADGKPMHVSYTCACGKLRVCLTDQYPTTN